MFSSSHFKAFFLHYHIRIPAKNITVIPAAIDPHTRIPKAAANTKRRDGGSRNVHSIYRMYMEGKSSNAIATYLTQQNIPSPAGKPSWLRCTVESILRNEKYKGAALLQKKFTVDFLQSQKQRRHLQAAAMDDCLTALEEVDLLQIQFSDALWNTVVDHVTVYADKQLVFYFSKADQKYLFRSNIKYTPHIH